MELWFSDYHTDKVKMSVKVEKQLFGEQTDFQRIDVFDSKEFGRFISSDGSIVFSEKDEFVYDEMIVHVPMAVHPNVRRVLVIGGGDGGVARELSYYKEIEEIDVVEPDEVFVDVCKKFFPDNARPPGPYETDSHSDKYRPRSLGKRERPGRRTEQGRDSGCRTGRAFFRASPIYQPLADGEELLHYAAYRLGHERSPCPADADCGGELERIHQG